MLYVAANYQSNYVLSIFSLSLFILLFSSLKTEVILVISYFRKPWGCGDNLLGTVQVQNVLQPGDGWLSPSVHKNLGSAYWDQGEGFLWIMPAGVKTNSLIDAFLQHHRKWWEGRGSWACSHVESQPGEASLQPYSRQPSFLSCLCGRRREMEGCRGNNQQYSPQPGSHLLLLTLK